MSNGIHSCGYHCERPACIKAQRSHLYAENAQLREAARMALDLILSAESEPSWEGYALTVDKARDTLRAPLHGAAQLLTEDPDHGE